MDYILDYVYMPAYVRISIYGVGLRAYLRRRFHVKLKLRYRAMAGLCIDMRM